MRIVLCYPTEPKHIAAIVDASSGAEVIDAGQERIAEEILDADIYCGHAKVPVPWEQVIEQGRLRWIQSSAAGTDHCLEPCIVESDLMVTSASGVLADQVAEHTVGLVTAWMRSLPTFFNAQQKHEFIRRPTRDLTGATVGIIGLGGVGRRLAEVLAPFRVRILATDLYPYDKPSQVESLWPADRIDDLLAASDVVVLCAPLTDATRGLINREKLAKMKPSALLVNVARGPIVVEADLVAALEAEQLAGAVMDVTEVEPLSPESRLWDIPNVIITPHVAGQSAVRIDNMTDFFCANLRAYREGQPLKNVVDKRQGFPVREQDNS